jgi:amino acid permease
MLIYYMWKKRRDATKYLKMCLSKKIAYVLFMVILMLCQEQRKTDSFNYTNVRLFLK